MSNRRKTPLQLTIVLSLLTPTLSVLSFGQTAQTPAQLGVPRLVKFSGLLKDSSGNALADTVGVIFAVYGEQTGGVPLWQETQNVQFSQGRYTVFLGESTSGGIPSELFASGQTRWLGVKALLPGEEEQPRIQLASVPYALKAVDADTLGGLPASSFVRTEDVGSMNGATVSAAAASSGAQSVKPPSSSPVTTSGGTVGTIPVFNTATDIENSPITDSGGNISIANQLTVVGPSTLSSVNGVLNAASCSASAHPSWCKGSDIGAWVNAAVTKLDSCGEIYIPAGTYTQTTSISIPRCIKLHGASAMSTRITWTPTGGWAIVVADNQTSLDYNFSYEGAVEDLTLYGPGVANTAGAIYLGGSDGAANSPSTSSDPQTNLGDHFNINRVRIMRLPSAIGFNVGIQWGANAWSNTIFESIVAYSGTGLYFPSTIATLNSGEDISILNSSIQNNTGIGLNVATGNNVNVTAVNTSFDFNGPSCPSGGTCTWQIQNGTATSQNVISLVNSYLTSGDHWLQNYGYIYIGGSLFTGGQNSGTLGYLIDNENANNFTVSGGQFFNGGTGCITNSAGQFSSWYGVLATSPGTCANGGITSAAMVIDRFGNGSFQGVYTGGNVVYRCTAAGVLPAGALTITPGSCGSTAGTGLIVR
jgi:hypothetical protein